MYPLTLIKLSKGKKIMLELKDKQIVTGVLQLCDIAMNLHLKNVVIEDQQGKKRLVKECFLKGQNINYVKIDPRVLEKQYLFEKNSQSEQHLN